MPASAPEVRFSTLAYGGEAVGRLPDGRAVFVPFALPGERAIIRLVEEKERYARGQLVELLESSADRVQPRCRHFGVCGGCQLQHLEYSRQLEAKAAMLRDQLTRIGRLANPPIHPAVGSPSPWNYRNYVQFHLTEEGRLGYVAGHHHGERPSVIPIQECHLPNDPINALWPQLGFEGGSAVGRVAVRSGTGSELMIILESSSPAVPELEIEAAVSVVHEFAGDSLLQAGANHLSLTVLGRTFRVSASTFFQVNLPVAEQMVAHIMSQIPDRCDLIIDAYCGAGLFSAFLAPRCGRLIGIEESATACEDFAANLDEFDNVDLYEDSAENALPALEVRPDVVILDPPRSGLHPRAVQALVGMQPGTVIYVSCDPATLARDASQLGAAGYQLESITPFDMFPQTYHIESLSVFRQ